MRKIYLLPILLMLICFRISAQDKPEDFGYQYESLIYEKDTVHILIKSAKGEEKIRKPIFFEVQGSSAVPLIVHDGKRLTSLISLSEGIVEKDFHLILVNKPGLPLMSHKDNLTKRVYKDPQTKKYPKEYLSNNNLEYYVKRNAAVLNFLKKQSWADTSLMVVAGHSEGSTIAAHMADKLSGFTHLIYSGGTPYYSRILAMIQQERNMENNEENPWVKKSYEYWEDVVKYPNSLDRNEGWNTNRGTYSFSQSENDILKRLKIPVLISFGTNDDGAPFNDMFHIEVIKEKCTNFTFNDYVGLDHYYQLQSANPGSEPPTEFLNKVVSDWMNWIKENSRD